MYGHSQQVHAFSTAIEILFQHIFAGEEHFLLLALRSEIMWHCDRWITVISIPGISLNIFSEIFGAKVHTKNV